MIKGMTFTDRLIEVIKEKRTILCVGLDPQLQLLPSQIRQWAVAHYGLTFEAVGHAFAEFNCRIITAVEPYVAAVKPQMAFYEIYGQWGVWAFEQTVLFARSLGLVVVEDAKRGDGGDTAKAYADGHLGKVPFWDKDGTGFGLTESPIRCDALTVQLWIGSACLDPFLHVMKKFGAGVFVVDKTSFAPNSVVEQTRTIAGIPNWEALAHCVFDWGVDTEGEHGYRNLGVVMGATYPGDALTMRRILPNAWFLVPGYGRQGGGADGAVASVNDDGLGCVVNSSRGIIYAFSEEGGHFRASAQGFANAAAEAARFARDDLNSALDRAGKLKF